MRFTFTRSVILCACLTAPVQAQELPRAPERIVLTRGQSVVDAQRLAKRKVLSAALRSAWIASGQTVSRDDSPPKIVSGKILTPTLDVAIAPAAPKFSVRYKTGPAGLKMVVAYFNSSTTSQSLFSLFATPYGAPPSTHGTITVLNPGSYGQGGFSLYSAPGAWTLTALDIYDETGNSTFYQQADLEKLFPSLTITVKNTGVPDVTAPIVKGGKVLTPIVKLSSPSPTFAASLAVSDSGSGAYLTTVFVESPSQQSAGNSIVSPTPVINGKVTGYDYLGGSTETGIWTIFGFSVCDVAENCLYELDAADVKAVFGTTTFTVEN